MSISAVATPFRRQDLDVFPILNVTETFCVAKLTHFRVPISGKEKMVYLRAKFVTVTITVHDKASLTGAQT